MALFLSTTVNKVDKKGRVSVPASFRNAVSGQNFNGIIAFPCRELGALDACGMDHIEKLAASLNDPGLYSPEEIDLAQLKFGESKQLAFDDTGRIVIPKDLITLAGITDRLLFAGNGPTFQMWDPDRFEAYKQTTLRNAESKGIELRRWPILAARRRSGGGS